MLLYISIQAYVPFSPETINISLTMNEECNGSHSGC